MAIYAIPASSIVNKLNIISYSSMCTNRTITVAVVHSIYSHCVRELAQGARDNESGQYCIQQRYTLLLVLKQIRKDL